MARNSNYLIKKRATSVSLFLCGHIINGRCSGGNRMESKLMSKILKEKKIKISEMPDDLNIEDLPDDVEIILDEHFPELDDDFWEDDD